MTESGVVTPAPLSAYASTGQSRPIFDAWAWAVSFGIWARIAGGSFGANASASAAY